jgi:hypothetical protein
VLEPVAIHRGRGRKQVRVRHGDGGRFLDIAEIESEQEIQKQGCRIPKFPISRIQFAYKRNF